MKNIQQNIICFREYCDSTKKKYAKMIKEKVLQTQVRLYKDESLRTSDLEKLVEIYHLLPKDNAKFITRQECLNFKQQADRFIFVFSEFDGAAFNHIRSLNSRQDILHRNKNISILTCKLNSNKIANHKR